jgi:Protein of unknown function (DUF1566)
LACEPVRYEALDQGRQLRDPRSGLIWQRCVIGQRWDGATCRSDDALGETPGKLLTYREAMREALRQNERRTDNAIEWRVPNETELRSMALAANCSAGSPVFLDQAWFPSSKAWSERDFLWFAGAFDVKRGVQIMSITDMHTPWVGYGDQVLHHLRLVR